MKSFGRQNFKRFMCSLVRQNFAKECEEAINSQINMELQACHNYMALAFYFDRSEVAAPGTFKLLNEASHEERQHAEMLMTYMNKRGGIIKVKALQEPKLEIACIKDAIVEALNMEKTVNQVNIFFSSERIENALINSHTSYVKNKFIKNLLKVHAIASKNNDPNMCDFIEANFLQEQVDAIKQLGDLITQIKRSDCELGTYLFDKYLLTNNANMHKK